MLKTQTTMHSVLVISLALAAFGMRSAAQEPIPLSDRILGIWANEQLFGPVVSGTLTIDARGSEQRGLILANMLGTKLIG
jgi:hypothetical protein